MEWLASNGTFLILKAFPVEGDGDGGQLSTAYGQKFPDLGDGGFFIKGFLDLNIDAGPGAHEDLLVTETQFIYPLAGGFNLFVEYRYSEFLAAKSGVGLGLQIRF